MPVRRTAKKKVRAVPNPGAARQQELSADLFREVAKGPSKKRPRGHPPDLGRRQVKFIALVLHRIGMLDKSKSYASAEEFLREFDKCLADPSKWHTKDASIADAAETFEITKDAVDQLVWPRNRRRKK